MRYNYQLVVNMSTWNAFSGGSFSVNGSNSSTWAVNRHLKNQWERCNWTFRGCESGWGGGGVGCLCGYHFFRSTPLFKTWHLQVMSVASQKLHRSRPFLRFKLIYLSQIFSSNPPIKTVHTDCPLHTWNTTARQFWLLVQNTWLRHTAKNTARLPGVSVGSRGNLEWNLSGLKVVV